MAKLDNASQKGSQGYEIVIVPEVPPSFNLAKQLLCKPIQEVNTRRCMGFERHAAYVGNPNCLLSARDSSEMCTR